jgi:acyl-coenzyme A synthetase/AMP-(fatty) acid ligase
MDTNAMTANPTVALTAHAEPDVIIAYQVSAGGVAGLTTPITQRQFLSDVAQLAAAFPTNGHLLNLCKNRYRFMVGVAAALVSRKISLLPSTYTATVIEQVRSFATDVFCLIDEEGAYDIPSDMLRVFYPAPSAPSQSPLSVPLIAAGQVAAYVFTSGSTGVPVPHAKTWGKLVENARVAQRRLQLATGTTLIGTVPSQHMYGFEATVLLTLHGGCALWAGHPFHPTEVFACLQRAPQPRVLVTTPVHLRALLNAALEYPTVQGVLCATAPLPTDVALAAEQCLKGPLTEIYGSTETGQLATRRTTHTPQWHLHEGITLERVDGNYYACGGHVEEKVALNDIVVPEGERHFLLQGRSSDLVNIAGKRSSLSYLGHQLLAIDGVLDGCYFMPQADAEVGEELPDSLDKLPDTTRLCAVVVAPGMLPKDIVRALRQRIDAVFLPRPLIMLEKLPRNATGKLPHAVLQGLWRSYHESKAAAKANENLPKPVRAEQE